MPGRHADELAMDRPAFATGGHGAVGRHLLDSLPDFGRRDRGRKRLTKGHNHGIRQFLRPFPEKPAALVAEDTSPNMVEADRNHRHRGPLENLFEAALEGEQKPGSGDASFRENADGISFFQRFTGSAKRLNDGSRPPRPIDRDDPGEPKEIAKPWQASIRRPNDEPHRPSLSHEH